MATKLNDSYRIASCVRSFCRIIIVKFKSALHPGAIILTEWLAFSITFRIFCMKINHFFMIRSRKKAKMIGNIVITWALLPKPPTTSQKIFSQGYIKLIYAILPISIRLIYDWVSNSFEFLLLYPMYPSLYLFIINKNKNTVPMQMHRLCIIISKYTKFIPYEHTHTTDLFVRTHVAMLECAIFINKHTAIENNRIQADRYCSFTHYT